LETMTVGSEKNMLCRCFKMSFLVAYIVSSSIGMSFVKPTMAQPAGRATLILKITGFRSEKGQVRIAVFNAPEKWPEEPIYSSTIDVNGEAVVWRINDVPYGDYAVAVFHDENRNGKMDKNLLGMPLEAYGFSNNVRVTFGAPKWENTKFAVKTLTKEVSIEVK